MADKYGQIRADFEWASFDALANLGGKQFGSLTVLEYSRGALNGQLAWECKCSCGGGVLTDSYSLQSGWITSCRECA